MNELTAVHPSDNHKSVAIFYLMHLRLITMRWLNPVQNVQKFTENE